MYIKFIKIKQRKSKRQPEMIFFLVMLNEAKGGLNMGFEISSLLELMSQ